MSTFLVTSTSLLEYFVDKDTGAPLAGGTISFWKDADRLVAKNVYEKVDTGAVDAAGNPIYEYVDLPNPMTLSGVGTPQDNNGNNVAIYYFPFEGTPTNSNGVVELYYVTVASYLGVPEFVREGWPGSGVTGGGTGGDGSEATNMLSNSQFVDVNFDTAAGLSYTSTGAESVVISIAPDWNLNVTFTAVGVVNVDRVAIAGNADVITNPPYSLEIEAVNNISSITLTQRLNHNPGIWCAQNDGVGGYVASYIVIGAGDAVTMNYVPSVGAPTQLLAGNNAGAAFDSLADTIQLDPSANTDDGDDGYVDIEIVLATTGTTAITSVQVLPLSSDEDDVDYIEEPVNRQVDHLFNYYKALLSYKPIPSYLYGWDFALNPRQCLGDTIAAFATGVNTSNYVVDQTIVFQSATNSFTTSVSVSGGLLLTATADTKLAIIQYVDGTNIRNMTLGDICSMVEAYSDVVGGLTCTVSLWGTLDANVPDIKTPNFRSLVATLDANGKPATFNGTWVEIPRNFGAGTAATIQNATFTIEAANTQTDADPNNLYPFAGWSGEGVPTLADDADFLAIVIGTATIPTGRFIHLQSATWQDGSIPTRPAPQTYVAVQHDCYRYYEKSFNQTVAPAQNVGLNTGEFSNSQILGAGVSTRLSQITFQSTKRGTPSITLYNPAAANAQVRNESLNADCSGSTITTSSPRAFAISCTTAGGSAAGETLGVHWVADARIGVL